MARHKNATNDPKRRARNWSRDSELNRALSIVLIIAVVAAAGVFSYAIIRPNREALTEFYLLGINGQAEDYPTRFVAAANPSRTPGSPLQVVSVQYGTDPIAINERWGRVVLGIVNHEERRASYTVGMTIAGQQVEIPFEGSSLKEIGPLQLADGATWEHEIGIVPSDVGKNQKVEVFLYKDGGSTPYLELHLWIDVEDEGKPQ